MGALSFDLLLLLQTKCEKYWPDEGEREMYGDLVVQVRSQSVLPDYIIRVIDVKLVSLRVLFHQ